MPEEPNEFILTTSQETLATLVGDMSLEAKHTARVLGRIEGLLIKVKVRSEDVAIVAECEQLLREIDNLFSD